MPHLPFASVYPSFAVSASDSRGAFAPSLHDGAFRRLGAFDPSGRMDPPPTMKGFPSSASPSVIPTTIRRAAQTTKVEEVSGGPNNGRFVDRGAGRAHFSPTSSAFTGSVGHHAYGNGRMGDGAWVNNRPTLADLQHVRVRTMH